MNKKQFQPPYYAVIFINKLTDNIAGYHEMVNLAQTMPGFPGYESAREKPVIKNGIQTMKFMSPGSSVSNSMTKMPGLLPARRKRQ